MTIPTTEQFRAYRQARLNVVRRITRAIRNGVIPKTPWAVETVGRQRREVQESRQRQQGPAK